MALLAKIYFMSVTLVFLLPEAINGQTSTTVTDTSASTTTPTGASTTLSTGTSTPISTGSLSTGTSISTSAGTSTPTIPATSTTAPTSSTGSSPSSSSQGTSSTGSSSTTSPSTSTTSLTTTTTPFSFFTCRDCNSMSITETSGQSNLIRCCDVFSQCCSRARQIQCPSGSNGSNFRCSMYGPFCAGNNNCPNGAMCCPSSVTGFRCCWAP